MLAPISSLLRQKLYIVGDHGYYYSWFRFVYIVGVRYRSSTWSFF